MLPAYKLVSVRQCTTGEVQTSPELCSACPASSFSFNSSQTACNICPANANCSGGANLVPLSQYWHSSPSSDHIISCPNNYACQGDRNALMLCKNASYMLQAGAAPVRHIMHDYPGPYIPREHATICGKLTEARKEQQLLCVETTLTKLWFSSHL